MAYVKNNWVDREGTTRYFETVDDDGALIFTPDYTQVTELGTPVNSDNMNHIEEGIAAGSFTKYDTKTTYVLNDLVTVIENDLPVIYKSLQNNNIGNALSDSAYWEKITLGGGGSGLEIGDIGIAPLGIDETQGKRRYLNGQVIIQEQYVQFTNKVKSAVELYPSLACTEAEWKTIATMTVSGQVGKFVIDDEGGTIRLPRIIMPIQGLTDLSKLAEIVSAGLPTHTHTRGTMNITGTFTNNGHGSYASTSGAFSGGGNTNGNSNDGHATDGGTFSFNAASAWTGETSAPNNPIYGKSSTVQQEQIQYPYFIQVATGAVTEGNIINEIELNNPFSLLDYKYSEYELNNLSWLRSNGQHNSKAIYPAVYDLLLKIYNGTETKAGVSVKLSTQSFTDYDFVLNTADETFRLPISVNNSAQGYLYFYVGETVQNANLINAGRIEEKVASLIPDNSSLISGFAMPSSKYIDLTLGASPSNYTVPANGYVVFRRTSTGAGQNFQLVNSTRCQIQTWAQAGTSSGIIGGYIPVQKGDNFAVAYTLGSASNQIFRFIYAESEV